MERFLLLALVGVGLVACARAPSTPSPEKAVAARSMAYWGAMVDQQYTNAYELLSQGFRARVGKDAFMLRFAGKTRWEGADIQSVKCEEDRCVVTVNARYSYVGNELFPSYSSSTEITEAWILQDGNWWLVPKR
ncbi:MAG: hypothetical protein H6953_08320 [Chromatiaceae bacterium]|nr:hypothetical protein [Chromatiaceae bacterium]MCP5315397.1 hypothetical protein [Chromatiaceae bacterium]